jgi:hypothetical protein
MSIRGRLKRLERLPDVAEGRCPVCGSRPDDIASIVIVMPPGMPLPPPDGPPPEPCAGCGRLLPIPFIYCAAEEADASAEGRAAEEGER